MRQVVRTADGELTYPSMAEVKRLYEQGFISPEDEIRAEDSTRWARASSLRVLAEAENRGKTQTKMGLRVAMGIALSILLAGGVEHHRSVFMGGLVMLGVLTALWAYQPRA